MDALRVLLAWRGPHLKIADISSLSAACATIHSEARSARGRDFIRVVVDEGGETQLLRLLQVPSATASLIRSLLNALMSIIANDFGRLNASRIVPSIAALIELLGRSQSDTDTAMGALDGIVFLLGVAANSNMLRDISGGLRAVDAATKLATLLVPHVKRSRAMHVGLDALLLLIMPNCLWGSMTVEAEEHALAVATQTVVLHMAQEAPVRSALGVLDKFTENHVARLLATPTGAVPFERLVAEALRRYIADHDVAEYACGVLRKLLPLTGGRAVEARLLAVGVAELCAEATRRHVGDDEATPATTWLLRRLSELPETRATGRLADVGGAEAALAVLRKYQAHPVISWNCCEALARMAEAPRARLRLVAAGAVPALVAALQRSVSGHVFFLTAQVAAARAVRNLAASPECRGALMTAGCPKAAMAAMQSIVARHASAMRRAIDAAPSEDDSGAANVCGLLAAALFGLSCDLSHRPALIAAGLATATLESMSEFG